MKGLKHHKRVEVLDDIINMNNMAATERGRYTIARWLEKVYMDDFNVSVTLEEELNEIKEKLPGFLQENGIKTKTSTCKDTQASHRLSNHGFISTTSILRESKNSLSYSKEGDKGEDINDGVLIKNNPEGIEQYSTTKLQEVEDSMLDNGKEDKKEGVNDGPFVCNTPKIARQSSNESVPTSAASATSKAYNNATRMYLNSPNY